MDIFIGKCYKLKDIGMGFVKINSWSMINNKYSGDWYYKDSTTTCTNYWDDQGKCCVKTPIEFDLVQECNIFGEVEDGQWWGSIKPKKAIFDVNKEPACTCRNWVGVANGYKHDSDCEYILWKKWKDEQLKNRK